MKKYEEVKLEIIEIKAEDVIQTSPGEDETEPV